MGITTLINNLTKFSKFEVVPFHPESMQVKESNMNWEKKYVQGDMYKNEHKSNVCNKNLEVT